MVPFEHIDSLVLCHFVNLQFCQPNKMTINIGIRATLGAMTLNKMAPIIMAESRQSAEYFLVILSLSNAVMHHYDEA